MAVKRGCFLPSLPRRDDSPPGASSGADMDRNQFLTALLETAVMFAFGVMVLCGLPLLFAI